MTSPGLGAATGRKTALRLGAGVLIAVVAVGWGLTRVFGNDTESTWAEVLVDDLVLGVDVEGTLASRDASVLTPPQVASVQDFQIRFMAPEGIDYCY